VPQVDFHGIRPYHPALDFNREQAPQIGQVQFSQHCCKKDGFPLVAKLQKYKQQSNGPQDAQESYRKLAKPYKQLNYFGPPFALFVLPGC